MFMLYFDGAYHQYYHAVVYAGWTDYAYWRPGESLWLVPGTDPEDDAYGRDYPEQDEDDNEGDEDSKQMTAAIRTEAAALAASKGYAASQITKINLAGDGSLASIELGVDADGFGIFVLNFAL